MVNNKISTNYLLNMMYNILTIIVPLVTTPYVSRVLGAEGVGIYSYCLSIQTYFIIAGTLGIPTYARRAVAVTRNDKDSLNKVFSELWILQLLLLMISFFIYLFVSRTLDNYFWMFLVCGIGMIASFFDVSWLLAGLEEFKGIVFRNFIVKMTSVFAIFIFVKTVNDLYIYGACIMVANLIGNLWMWSVSYKYIKFVKFDFRKIFRHIGPAFILLLPTMVTSINQVVDKTMMGYLANNMAEVGYYEQAQKVITISVTVVTSLGAVLMPRLAALFNEKKKEEVTTFLKKGIEVICFVSIPLAVGVSAISNNLVPWFYGNGFEKVEFLLIILAPLMFLLGFNDLIGVQLLVAVNKEKSLFIANLFGVLTNIVMNSILIPKYLCYGAAFATVFSELVKTVCFCVISGRYFDFVHLIKSIGRYLTAALPMGAIVVALSKTIFVGSSMFNTMIMILIGGCIYGCILMLMKDSWCLYGIKMVTGRLKNIKK